MISSFKREDAYNKQVNRSNNFFLKGFIVSATNPKGLLFASAFFPQFLNSKIAIGPQAVVLCIGFILISFTIEIIYSYVGSTTGKIFGTDSFKRLTERISAVFLIIFGIGLSFVKKNN